MGLNQSLPFFSMENERVERLSQRVEQWLAPLSHSEMILGSNGAFLCGGCMFPLFGVIFGYVSFLLHVYPKIYVGFG